MCWIFGFFPPKPNIEIDLLFFFIMVAHHLWWAWTSCRSQVDLSVIGESAENEQEINMRKIICSFNTTMTPNEEILIYLDVLQNGEKIANF